MPKWLAALWLSIADAFDDVFLFPTSQDRKFGWLCEAIAARRPVSFDYHGGRRTVEPFCLGLVQPGRRRNVSLLCYQTGGHAELASEVGWKLYRAWDIEEPAAGGEAFPGDRPGYDPDQLPMHRIYCRVEPLRRWEGPPAESIEAFLHGAGNGGEMEMGGPGHNDLMRRFRSHHVEETPPRNTEPAPPHVTPAPKNLPEES